MRATVQYNPPGSGTNYYAEIGWYKDSSGIHVHVASQDPIHFHFEQSYSQQPALNSTHNYSVLWNSSQSAYDLSYDGALIVTRPASFQLTRVFSGGEVSSSLNNAMGISGNLNNQYATTSYGTWTYYPSHYSNVAPGYRVTDLSASSWQVGGNN